MQPIRRPRRFAPPRGTSLLGLVVIAVIVGFIMLMGARVFPAINEYLTIRKVVGQIMRQNPTSATEVRNAFEHAKEVEYSIHTIGPGDLDVKKVNDRLRCSFSYNAEVPIVEPVYLLFKFEGSADSGGSGPATP